MADNTENVSGIEAAEQQRDAARPADTSAPLTAAAPTANEQPGDAFAPEATASSPVVDGGAPTSPSRHDRPAYERAHPRHVSQPPVNDVEADDALESSYGYETGYTIQKRGLGGKGAYRRAQSQQNKIRQELKYGQYLSVPKGNREIFGSRENERKKKLTIAAVIIVALIIVALIVFWPK